jgi:glucans biosynthesis protein
MSSMFWFGENSRRRFDDFRPEVHDSDGLAIRMGTGERIWRPLSNDSGHLEFSFFGMQKCFGFGLVQRDRRLAAYEDAEAAYHERPTLWIEPTSEWGPGKVMLMEIPTVHELSDNVVAMWVPDHAPQPGERIEFNYRQSWTMNPDPSVAGGRVVATRTGVHEWQRGHRGMVVEFAGGALDLIADSEPPQPVVMVVGEGPPQVVVKDLAVHRLADKRWRVNFQLVPAQGLKPEEVGQVELRCALKKGADFLTESWAYRITPWQAPVR